MSRGSLAASFDHYSPPKTEQLLGITTFLGPQVTQAPAGMVTPFDLG